MYKSRIKYRFYPRSINRSYILSPDKRSKKLTVHCYITYILDDENVAYLFNNIINNGIT